MDCHSELLFEHLSSLYNRRRTYIIDWFPYTTDQTTPPNTWRIPFTGTADILADPFYWNRRLIGGTLLGTADLLAEPLLLEPPTYWGIPSWNRQLLISHLFRHITSSLSDLSADQLTSL